jgi:hypothetical protein
MKYDPTKDSVKTPKYITDWVRKTFGKKLYDPVPFNTKFDKNIHKDGLTTEWGPVSFVNPPYSRAGLFVKKAVEQWKQGKTVIMLVKIDVLYRQYFYANRGCEIKLFKKKVTFVGYDTPARTGVVLLIYRKGKTSNKYSFFP